MCVVTFFATARWCKQPESALMDGWIPNVVCSAMLLSLEKGGDPGTRCNMGERQGITPNEKNL